MELLKFVPYFRFIKASAVIPAPKESLWEILLSGIQSARLM